MLSRVQRYSVKDLLDMGIGDRTIPRYQIPDLIAKIAKDQYRPRGGRRGTVGNISSLGPTVGSGIANSQWAAVRSSGVPNPYTATNPVGTTTQRQPVSYTFGSTGVGAINQIAQTTTTVAVSGGSATQFNMSVWAFNVIGDASATFTAVKEWWVELLTATQAGSGATASSLVCGHDLGQPWNGLLLSTTTYTIGSGGCWYHQDQTSAGVGVTSGDILLLTNGDAVNIATVRLTAFGFK